MSKEQCMNKKLHPYYKTGIYGYIGEEVDDNDYIICPICGEVLGMNYWDYSAENYGDDKCPKCKQELDYSEIYDFEDTCYYEQLVEIKEDKIADLETKLAESEERINWLVEAEFNRKWAKKYVEMRRKEDPMLCLPDSDEVYEKYFELKQQLAEKEKEIENRLNYQKDLRKINDELTFELNDTKQLVKDLKRKHHQDKISFALEQLEKVKDLAHNRIKEIANDLSEEDDERLNQKHTIHGLATAITDIANQIKQLKEKNNG